uniref:Histonelysine Nmethyltransferase SETMARlike [Hydra vulgaris] n=1 Tax=Lepeophtheirus salmonis TaxID=72036 RepID=A0A0K2UQ49_LEPSM
MTGKMPQETKKKLDKHYGDSTPSIRIVHKWFQKFPSSHMGTSDAARLGHPVKGTTREIIVYIHVMVMDDKRIKMHEIASAVGIRMNGYIIFYINNWT